MVGIRRKKSGKFIYQGNLCVMGWEHRSIDVL